MRLWLNGRLHDADIAGIAPGDRGLLLGDGIYETLLVRDGTPMQMDAHLARLRHGAGVIGLPMPGFDLPGAIYAVLAANGVRDGALRLTLTRGSGPRGIAPPAVPTPTVMITTAPAAAPLAPARCIVATCTRRNEHSPLAGIKSVNCLDAVIARIEATQRGADDAILLNTAGQVAEATASTLFVLLDGQLVTPPLADGVLPGITRARMLVLGAGEKTLTPDMLAQAAQAFLTSSLGVRGIGEIDGRPLASQTVADNLRPALGFAALPA